MKYLFALFFLTSSTYSFADKERDTIHYVTIEQAITMDIESVTAINLSKRKLTKLPKELMQFKYLRHLNVSNNKLTEIPEFLSSFTQLKDLNISKNKFTVFPSEICKMKSLKMKNLKNIEMQGIVYGPTYQQKWIRGLHWVKIEFDAPCDCMEK